MAALLAGAWLAQPCLAQGQAAKPQAPAVRAEPVTITITGKITKGDAGYLIQGQKPPEIFTILNPDPKVLDKLVQSGQTVTLEAVSVVGDNVNLRKIDGQPYKGPKESKTRGK